jgi:hypothetical protein
MDEMPEDEAEDPFEGVTGAYLHSGMLWTTALDLARRFQKADADGTSDRMAMGLSTVLFAAISIETFLNEITQIASQHEDRDPTAKAVKGALEEVEQYRGSIRLKLLVAGLALERPLNKGARPYQDFDLLFRVRDEIVHLKAHRHTFIKGSVKAEPEKLLTVLRQKKLICDPTIRPVQSFLSMITSVPLCNWSVETAQDVMRHLVGLLPDGDFRRSVSFPIAGVLGTDPVSLTSPKELTSRSSPANGT